MPFLNENFSVVEVIALVAAAMIVLAILVGFFFNLPALIRYLRMRRM